MGQKTYGLLKERNGGHDGISSLVLPLGLNLLLTERGQSKPINKETQREDTGKEEKPSVSI